jgi:hypothetical protein
MKLHIVTGCPPVTPDRILEDGSSEFYRALEWNLAAADQVTLIVEEAGIDASRLRLAKDHGVCIVHANGRMPFNTYFNQTKAFCDIEYVHCILNADCAVVQWPADNALWNKNTDLFIAQPSTDHMDGLPVGDGRVYAADAWFFQRPLIKEEHTRNLYPGQDRVDFILCHQAKDAGYKPVVLLGDDSIKIRHFHRATFRHRNLARLTGRGATADLKTVSELLTGPKTELEK